MPPQPHSPQARRIVVITGAGSGIGAAIALHFADHQHLVVCCGRRREACLATVQAIENAGGTAQAVACDIRDTSAVENTISHIIEQHGHIDVLIANAGIAENRSVIETSDSLLDDILRTNVQGTFSCCRAAFAHMLPRKEGAIITIGSVVSHKGYPQQAAYAASKHAVLGFTRSLCAEAQPHGIRVACVMPGGVATEMVRRTRPDLDGNQMIQPEDVANAVRYLVDLPKRIAIDSISIRRWNASPH
ncbi:MAG: SDR family oxidoreductase [Planctomycetota bacterium]|nr:MAG: SDR family oxidoreductase [Planctomycetota bacterium]